MAPLSTLEPYFEQATLTIFTVTSLPRPLFLVQMLYNCGKKAASRTHLFL